MQLHQRISRLTTLQTRPYYTEKVASMVLDEGQCNVGAFIRLALFLEFKEWENADTGKMS